jgi:fucose 4-O-acetylase-like acetyltransferase
MKRHYPAMRGLAILLVVLNHVVTLGQDIPVNWGFPAASGLLANLLLLLKLIGWYAVPVFLFISGSFFAYAAKGDPPAVSWKVVQNNVIHLTIPYLIWSIAYYVLIFIGYGQSFSVAGYAKNLLVGFPYHFIPLILFYFLISPLLLLFSKRAGWLLTLVVIAGYQVFLILALDGFKIGLEMPGWTNFFVIPVLARTFADWGIYFPLGLYLTLNNSFVMPKLEKFKLFSLITSLFFLLLAVLHSLQVFRFPLANHFYPLAFVFFLPVMKRDWIPRVRLFESVGKRAYGLYLTHLLVINAVLLLAYAFFPAILSSQLILQPVLFLLAVGIPLIVMNFTARRLSGGLYRYFFG